MNINLSLYFSCAVLFGLNAISNICAINPNIVLMNPKKNWTHFFDELHKIEKFGVFIESGTYLGETTAKAEKCFESVHTIEINLNLYNRALDFFKDKFHVKVHFGDSPSILNQLLPSLDQSNSIIFWLDGHMMESVAQDKTNASYTPILEELNAIKEKQLKNAVILIDDMRLFGTMLNNARIPRAGCKHYPLLKEILALLPENYFYECMGDVLIIYDKAIPLECSPVLKACTISRLFDGFNYDVEKVLAAENTIAQAQGEEYDSITELYNDFAKSWRGWCNKSPHYNLWYGLILQHHGEHEKAIEQFNEAINLGYDHWRIFWYWTQSLYALKDFKGAADISQKVLLEAQNFKPALELLQLIQN